MRGDDRFGRSVGRRAAGTYNGPFGGRIWRCARGICGTTGALWTETGDEVDGVAFADTEGD